MYFCCMTVIKAHQFIKSKEQESPVIILDNVEIMQQKLDYLHNNPVVAEIVEEPQEYIYSSAKFYAEHVSLIKCERM